MRSIIKGAPSIPPSWVYVDCYDARDGEFGVVGRPASFLMRNRGGTHSLCDAVFQAMFGVCDRYNILRAAVNFTLLRSANFFKPRWMEHYVKMSTDCGITLSEEELECEWEELLSVARDECEELEAIHIFVLAHVVKRPIVVTLMDDPTEMAELSNLDQRNDRAKLKYHHLYEGIYLPVLWDSPPATQSPLVIAYRNGAYYAVIVSDVTYPRDHEVGRFLKLRLSRHSGENLFRFLVPSEMETSYLSQFMTLGSCNNEVITIRRDPHNFLVESLEFYARWLQALLQCWDETRDEPVRMTQLERKMASAQTELGDTYTEKILHFFTSKAVNVMRSRSSTPPHHSRHHTIPRMSSPRAEQIDLEEPAQSEDEEEEEDE